MGFLPECGAIEIAKIADTHPYMFGQYRNRLYFVCRNLRGSGEIYESRNQGLLWLKVDDIGPVDSIAIRGGEVWYFRPSRQVGRYNLLTGNIDIEKATRGPGPNSGVPIPLPEIPGNTLMVLFQEIFGSGYYIYRVDDGALGARVPGRSLFYVWGTEEDRPILQGGSLYCVWRYVDPFFEPITYASLARYKISGSWEIFQRYPNSSTPAPHAFENFIHGSGYLGFANARSSWEGVGHRRGNPDPSFFEPADHWQGNENNQAPLWVPDMSSTNSLLKAPIASTPNGLSGDTPGSRGAVMGYVGGRRTFGMIEPGYGFAHCVGNGLSRRLKFPDRPPVFSTGGSGPPQDITEYVYDGNMHSRKFMGNLGVPISRSLMWMPYSSGIFGMGVTGTLGNGGLQAIWIYDKEPTKIPTSVLVDNGVYTERSDDDSSQATRRDSKYYRW